MNKSTIVAGVHPWFPKCIPEKCIPALKSIGQAGWTLGEDFKVDGDTAKHYIINKRLTPEEQLVSRQLAIPFQITVSMILANGPKIFVIPPDLIDNLDKVEVSLKVKDFVMPFPAIIVKNKQEYHFVVQLEDQIMLAVAVGVNEVDYLAMHKKEAKIESYLSGTTITWTHGTDFLNDESEIIPNGFQHRFRATLNFIAMLMMGGFKKTKLSDSAKRRKYATGVARSTKPDEYESQDIHLWRTTLIDINRREEDDEDDEAVKGAKRPHWRRAHYRKAKVGEGRTETRIVFVKTCRIHKEQDADLADTEYVCS